MDTGPNCPTCGTRNSIPRLDLESKALQEILRSDHNPTYRDEIEATILLVDEEYQCCAAEIIRLQLRIQSLSSRQQQLQLCGSNLRCRLSPSPTRKLPNEVLMYVFDYVSQDNLFREDREVYSKLWPDEDGLTSMPALVLSSVCTRWRQISLSYSALWSRMTVIIDSEDPDPDFDELTTTLELYVNRSGSSLLRLRIDSDEVYSHPALSLLLQNSHRWQSLTCIAHHYLSRCVSNIHTFPMLKELKLATADPVRLEIFGQASKLQSLGMESFTLISQHRAASFPWKQLRSLDVPYEGKFDRMAFEHFLGCFPNLTSLRLRIYCQFSNDVEASLSDDPKTIPNLKSLSVMLDNGEPEIDLLNVALSSFSCPSLTALNVERAAYTAYVTPKYTWPFRALRSFLIQSSSTLASLSIRGFEVPDNDRITILDQLPTLASFIIEEPCFESTDPLFHTRRVPFDHLLLTPQLQHLSNTRREA